MPVRPNPDYCQDLWGRSLRALVVCLTVAWVFSCSRHDDPQQALDHAVSTLHHGDIAAAGKEAKIGYDRFHGVSTEWAWRFAILRARVLYWGGDNEKALDLLHNEPSRPCCDDLAVESLRLESIIFSAQHRFADASRELSEAQHICASGNWSACGDLNSTLGRMEMEKGHYVLAQDLFRKALASARARRDEYMEADALLKLSWSAEEQTHLDEAIDRADDAMRLSLPLRFPDITEGALGNTAWAYYKLGDSEKARQMFTEAEKQAERIGLLADRAKWLLDIGYVYNDNGDLTTAEKSYEQSLTLARNINSREDIINALISLAFVSEQTGNLDDAKRYAREALSMALEDGNKRDETYPRLAQGRIAARERDFTSAEAAFHEVENSPDSPIFLKWEAEHSLARLYEDTNQTVAADREYRIALSTFESARCGLRQEDSRLPFLNNAFGIYDDYIHFLVARGQVDEALPVAEYQRGRTLAEGLGLLKNASSQGMAANPVSFNRISFNPDQLNPQTVARKAGGAIFFYWLGEKQSYLWAITSQKTSFFSLPAKSQIEPVVARYRKMLADQMEILPQADADGRFLYRTLVAPAQTLLAQNTTQNKDAKVFIIPDGSLNTLNFETLITNEPATGIGPRYWIEDATIADASSLHLLGASKSPTSRAKNARDPSTSLRARMGHPARMLLIGDAVAANVDYPELHKASDEMESIKKHFASDQEQVFARDHATPAAYLTSKPEQFSYIHFVAHGTASRVSPLDSAIVLSPANTQDDSFKLYARDIIQRPLHTDLVTISTCYGAGARAYSGEGLVGLSWAFLRAGAQNVIGALWEVSDISTPQLMDNLYAGLQRGQHPDAALRAAKLSMLRSTGVFRKPFYWAPFQLYTRS